MCVILQTKNEATRPRKAILEACNQSNPHGIGIAWRDRGKVHWMKNLDVDDTLSIMAQLDGELVIHFRWASVGGVDPNLCHPFPVTATANTDLHGEAKSVLFHNGTWAQYTGALALLHDEFPRQRIDGPISDTRVAAMLARHCGASVLRKLPGKWVHMGSVTSTLYGDWDTFEGMKVSNLWWTSNLRTTPVRRRQRSGDWTSWSY